MKLIDMTRRDFLDMYGIEATWSTTMSMTGRELYSGDERDPVTTAMYACEEHGLTLDRFGNKRPYSVGLSLFGMDIKEGESIWEMSHRDKMSRQLVSVQVIVFRDQVAKDFFESEELTLTEYFKDEWE